LIIKRRKKKAIIIKRNLTLIPYYKKNGQGRQSRKGKKIIFVLLNRKRNIYTRLEGEEANKKYA